MTVLTLERRTLWHLRLVGENTTPPIHANSEVVREIRALLDRQHELLTGTLDVETVTEYGRIHKPIRELMDQLRLDTDLQG